jgi:gamma-glutamyl hercynylcysteine S-oxide synthase
MAVETTLRNEIARARTITDQLFRAVRIEAMYDRPIPERHRIVFYIGHLEAFDWNLIGTELDEPRFHPEFDRLFSFGIDPDASALPTDVPSDWPELDEVHEYVRRVRRELDRILDRAPDQLRDVALEHRLMHAETLAYMLHQLPLDRKCGPMPVLRSAESELDAGIISIPAGPATLGLRRGQQFGWDNEFEEHTVEVPAFTVGKYKVTNGEYLRFVESGAEPPAFWTRRDGGWYYRAMFGEVPLPLDWPVYVTQQEAAEYARWIGGSLPTEAQFHRAAYGEPDAKRQTAYPWGHTPPEQVEGNFDFRQWDPVPVNSGRQSGGAFGVRQMVGNGWEWTSSLFRPFPGFEPFPFYAGYSSNFFDDDHFVLKGGSPRTAARLLRRSFRNWFRKDYPYVYAGFRIVQN